MKFFRFLVVLHICMLPEMLHAQEQKPLFWFSLNGGAGTYMTDKSMFTLAGAIGFYYQPQHFIYGLKAEAQQPIILFENDDSHTLDYSALFGIGTRKNFYHAYVVTGLSVYTGRRRTGEYVLIKPGWIFNEGYYATKKFTTVGLPVELSFHFIVTKHFAAGLNLSGNINSVQNVGSAMLGIKIGYFGEKQVK